MENETAMQILYLKMHEICEKQKNGEELSDKEEILRETYYIGGNAIKKTIPSLDLGFKCSCCGENLGLIGKYIIFGQHNSIKYCYNCGQAIKWRMDDK